MPSSTGVSLATRRTLIYTGLSGGLVIAVLLSLSTGQFHIPFGEIVNSALGKLGFDVPPMSRPTAEAALWTIRVPRLLLGLLIGAALAGAGLLLQAIFGNPLADAGVIGISSGAAFGASVAIVFGFDAFTRWALPGMAFIGGLIAVLVVYFVSRSAGKTEVVTLILTGIAINAIASAGMGFMTFLANTASREQIIFWQLGSLNGAQWEQVGIIFPIVLVGTAIAFILSRQLDLFTLGEKSARHLGVNVEGLRIGVILLVAVLVSAAVAFAGIIAFVGLVVPHLMRMIIGPAHRPLLIASVLGGALLLVLADLVARITVPMADLPIGMVTSLVGGPFFLWLLIRTRRQSGGWG